MDMYPLKIILTIIEDAPFQKMLRALKVPLYVRMPLLKDVLS